MKNVSRPELITIMMIVVLAASRLLPHWPNFTPVMAMALMGGVAFGSTRKAFLVPLGAMVLSDVALGAVMGWEYALHGTQAFVYGSIVIVTLLGRFMTSASKPVQILGGGSAAAVLFFLVTNGAVWLTSGMYPATLSGLVMCYEAGLAFYRDGGNFFVNGLLSTWMYAAMIAMAPVAVGRLLPSATR